MGSLQEPERPPIYANFKFKNLLPQINADQQLEKSAFISVNLLVPHPHPERSDGLGWVFSLQFAIPVMLIHPAWFCYDVALRKAFL